MEYKLIKEYSYEDLSLTVSDHLEQGWELHGSPSMSIEPDYDLNFFVQAVTRTIK